MLWLAVMPTVQDNTVMGGLALDALVTYGVGDVVTAIVIGRERFARARPLDETEYLGFGNTTIGGGAAAGSLTRGALPAAWNSFSRTGDACRSLFWAEMVLYGLAVAWLGFRYLRKPAFRAVDTNVEE